jgi:hypothetical protein
MEIPKENGKNRQKQMKSLMKEKQRRNAYRGEGSYTATVSTDEQIGGDEPAEISRRTNRTNGLQSLRTLPSSSRDDRDLTGKKGQDKKSLFYTTKQVTTKSLTLVTEP